MPNKSKTKKVPLTEEKRAEKERWSNLAVKLKPFLRALHDVLFMHFKVIALINAEKWVVFEPKQIYIEKIREDKDENIKRSVHEIYQFHFFDCYKIIEHENFENNEYLCSVQIVGKSPVLTIKKTKRDLKQFLDENCFVAKTATSTKLFPLVFAEYLKIRNPERVQVSKVLGFSREHGWTLPPEFELEESSEIHTRIIKNFASMLNQSFSGTKEKFQQFYNAISIRYRDVCLAFAFASPFFFALKSETRLVPYLIFVSPDPETGKTEMAHVITYLFYSHQPPLSVSNLDSKSRMGDYFSATTFPISIEESESLDKKRHLDLLKAMATQDILNEKKRVDQSLKTSKPYQCTAVFTCNALPDVFLDDPFISRTLIIKFKDKPTIAEAIAYKKARKILTPGEIFQYFYKQLPKLNYNEVSQIYNSFTDLPELQSIQETRSRTLYSLLYLGKHFCKRVFDIDLDISLAIDLIKERDEYSDSDTILQAFEDYLLIQYHDKILKDRRSYKTPSQFFYLPDTTKADIIFTATNRKEMKKEWDIKDLSEDQLERVLKMKFEVMDGKRTHHIPNQKQQRGIRVSIPINFFPKIEEEDAKNWVKSWNEKPPQTDQPLNFDGDAELLAKLRDLFDTMREFPIKELQSKLPTFSHKDVKQAVNQLYLSERYIYEKAKGVYKKL